LSIARHLSTGDFTAFLAPCSGEEERNLLERWLAGNALPHAREELREKICRRIGNNWSVQLLSSGRSAIQVALEALRLPSESEVILPSFACRGVVAPVLHAGLRPVLADVDEQMNLRFESVLEANHPDVRALILPHLSGCWVNDAETILDWARTRGIVVIEDVAQAIGLEHKGRPAGTFADIAVYSCGPGKPLVGPGGGWIASRDPEISRQIGVRDIPLEPRERTAARIRRFLDQYAGHPAARGRRMLLESIRSRFARLGQADEEISGADPDRFPIYAMSDVEAAFASLQMSTIADAVTARTGFAARWRELFEPLGLETLRLPPSRHNVFAKMLLTFDGEDGTAEAEGIRRVLWANGVETEASYVPLHLRRPFNECRQARLPGTNRRWGGAFSVPVRPKLTEKDVARFESAVAALSRGRWRCAPG